MKYLNNLSFLFVFYLTSLFFFYSCEDKERGGHGINSVEEAELLAIYEREGYDEIFIVNPEGKELAHYVLIDKGNEADISIPKDAVKLSVPLEGLILDSEVYASAFEELNKEESIKGILDAQYVTSSNLKRKLKENLIEDVGQSTSPNTEKILSLRPDVLIISYYNGMQTEGLDRLGIPVIKMLDLQESSPLGRAEWLRFIGKLTGREETADSIFKKVKEHYNDIKNFATKKSDKNRPKVLAETIYEGIWSVPGGKSYQGKLIEDGGGNYFMKDDNTPVTLNLSPEKVLSKGGDSDIWIIKFYGDEKQLKDLLASDPLYKEINAYKEENIYFSDTSKSGLYREFPFHPDLLLEDYRVMFNNDTMANLRYFKKLQ